MPDRAAARLGAMTRYVVNEAGVAAAQALIDARRYRVRSRWADVQPSTADRNAYLERHTWEEYGGWHLALREGEGE